MSCIPEGDLPKKPDPDAPATNPANATQTNTTTNAGKFIFYKILYNNFIFELTRFLHFCFISQI